MTIYKIPMKIEGGPAAGGPFMNIWHVSADGTLNLEEAVDAIGNFYDGIAGYIPANCTAALGEGIIADPYGSPTYVDDIPRPVTFGGAGDQSLSTLLAVTVSWRTSSATRSGRGRTFVGPLVNNAGQGDGTPSAAFMTVVRAAAAALVADSGSLNGWEAGVFSQKESTFRPFTGSSVRDRWSYLSSRRD